MVYKTEKEVHHVICPNCHTEQYQHKFCNHCGENLQKLQEDGAQNKEAQLEVKNESVKSSNLVKEKLNIRKQTLQFTWNVDKLVLGKSMAMPLGVLTVMVVLAAIVAPLLNGSRIIKDYMYLFFTSTLHIGEQAAISLLSVMKLSMFDVLLAMHGGTINGTIWEDTGITPTTFVFQLPIILAIVFTITIVAVAFSVLKKFLHVSPMQKLVIVGVSAVVYSFVLIILLQILKPTYTINNYTFDVSYSMIGILFNSFMIVCIAGFIGFGPWKETNGEAKWLTVLQPLKRFFLTLLFLEAFISILMIITWFFTNPATLMAQPMSSPGTMWFVYRHDPLFYLLLPNIVLAEQLYAIGGTWQITTPLLGELIQVSNPFSINILTGSETVGLENAAAWTENIDSARFVWHPFALLLAFIYTVVKLPQKAAVMTKVYHGLAIAVLFGLLANWLTINFESQLGEGFAGFNALQVFVSTAIVVGIIYVVVFYVQKGLWKKRIGEES